MRKFVALILLSISLNAVAIDASDVNSAGFNNLSESDKAEIIKNVASKSAPAKPAKVIDVLEDTDKWVTVGASLGKGLAATAKELGVAANDLANTRLGMIATTLIVWNYFGNRIADVLGGFIFLFIGLMACNKIAIQEIQYDEQPNWLGIKHIKTIIYRSTDDWLITIMVARFTVLIISTALIV